MWLDININYEFSSFEKSYIVLKNWIERSFAAFLVFLLQFFLKLFCKINIELVMNTPIT